MAEGLLAVAPKALPRAMAAASWLGIRKPMARASGADSPAKIMAAKTGRPVFRANFCSDSVFMAFNFYLHYRRVLGRHLPHRETRPRYSCIRSEYLRHQ